MRTLAFIGMVIGALMATSPALAQSTAKSSTAKSRGVILNPLTLLKIDDLSWGTVIADPLAGGTITISPTGADPLIVGTIVQVQSDKGQPAKFAGAGTAGQLVIINVQNPVVLTNPAGNIVTVVALLLDGPNTRTIGKERSFYFHVGGTISILPNQAEGLYSADMPVTVTYM